MQNMIKIIKKNISQQGRSGRKEGSAVGQKRGGGTYIVEQERDRTSSNILLST